MTTNKTYTREEALKASTEYFGGDELAANVFVTKYALRDEKLELKESNPEQMHKRLAKEFARIEKKYPNPMSEEEIFGLFDRFKYVCPQGSPMFGIGNPNQRSSLSNCFVIDVVDSYGGICRADERIAQISKRRGGVGINLSPIRPKGMSTKNSALTTDGIVVFMDRFSNTAREVAQQGRRGALMESISVHHPEILNFIRAKRDLTKVTGANISVQVTDEFMKAAIKKDTYELRWPVDSDSPAMKKEVKAKEVWDELVKSNWMSGEPGILFIDSIIRNSPADSYGAMGYKTSGTNPCITGDTLVYVADGRGNIPIKQLAEEGKDIPVFCYDDSGKICVRKMINPRITGHKQPIYKITLDNKCVLRATGNHQIRLIDGKYKEVKDLRQGESVKIITRFEASIKNIFGDTKSKSSDYYWIANGFSNNKAEHRIIIGHKEGREIKNGEVVHHIDGNSKNNNPNNLKIMSKKKHDKIHRKNMMGKNNPMVRAEKEWSKKKWQKYREDMSRSVSGVKNGRYIDITNDKIREYAIKLTQKNNRRCSTDEWEKYILDKNVPIMSKYREKELGTAADLLRWAAEKCGLKYINEDTRVVKTLQKMLEQGYRAIIKNKTVYVEKTCEHCLKSFLIHHSLREQCFCGIKCSANRNQSAEDIKKCTDNINSYYSNRSIQLKQSQLDRFTFLKNKLSRQPLRKEWESECSLKNIPFRFGTKYGFNGFKDLVKNAELHNHRIVSVELDGYEDVYNGTVEDFHNFFVGGFLSNTFNKKNKWVYINNKNCGELPIPACSEKGVIGSCILLLQNLVSYVKNPFTKDAILDEELLKTNTQKAQRLIDDMIDLEIEAVDKIIEKIKNDPEDDKVKANELDLWNSVKKTCKESRRTGLGITGLGDCVAMLNIKYGSKESLKIVEKIFSIIRDDAYRSSIQMAKERGAFSIWDAKVEKDNVFLNRLPEDIKEEMKKVGRRNIACLTVPPAGSCSMLTQTSSGFEPVFMAEYVRKRKLTENDKDAADFTDQLGDKWKNYKVEHHGLKLFKQLTGKELKDSPYHGAQAEEIDYEARIKMQGIATSYVDHAISSTINLPKDIDIKTIEKLYLLAYEEGCKGLTIYRDGSRDGVLTKEASTNGRACEDCDEAAKGLKELVLTGHRPKKIIPSAAPSRDKVMKCEIHKSKVGKGDWTFFVGMLDDQPYEIFGGKSDKVTIPHNKEAWIIKNGLNKAGITQYNLVMGSLTDENEKTEMKDISRHFNNEKYGAITRLISLNLRHGTPIRFICEQLTKTGCAGDFFSFQRAVSRILKKYIADGEISGTECPLCKSTDVYYKNGCPTCKVCGNSNCS